MQHRVITGWCKPLIFVKAWWMPELPCEPLSLPHHNKLGYSYRLAPIAAPIYFLLILLILMCDNHWLWFSYTKATVNPNVKWYWCVNSKSREKNYIREGCWKKPSKYELFPKWPQPPPPFEKWTFWKQFLIFFLNRISQSESQNLRLVNFVPYKLIFLTVLTTF